MSSFQDGRCSCPDGHYRIHDWVCKIDLKDAYTVVPIHKDSRKYLSFLHQEPMRELGIRVVYCPDDIYMLAQTKKEMQSNMQTLLKHLQTLGFIINQTKSQLIPMKTQEFLGCTFDTVAMKISVPYKKIEKTKSRIKQVIKTTSPKSCRWVASLIGKMTAMIPAIGNALLHVRYLQRDLARSLRTNTQNWEAPYKPSREATQDLSWWFIMNTKQNDLDIRPPIEEQYQEPKFTIYVDAPDTGWGYNLPVGKYSRLLESRRKKNVQSIFGD